MTLVVVSTISFGSVALVPMVPENSTHNLPEQKASALLFVQQLNGCLCRCFSSVNVQRQRQSDFSFVASQWMQRLLWWRITEASLMIEFQI